MIISFSELKYLIILGEYFFWYVPERVGVWNKFSLCVCLCRQWGAIFTGLIFEEVTLNSYFRQKHLQIKTAEISSEKILAVRLSWTILH